MSSNWTASNALTLSRIFLTVPFVYCLSLNTSTGNWIAFSIALVAILTDYYDGKLARDNDQVTDLGKALDPVADKITMAVAGIYFAFFRGNMPIWFVLLLLGKDALILLGGLVLLSKKIVTQADRPGKYTVFVVALVFLCFIFDLDRLGEWAALVSSLFILHSTYFYYVKFLGLLGRCENRFYRLLLPVLVFLPIVLLIVRQFSPLSEQ